VILDFAEEEQSSCLTLVPHGDGVILAGDVRNLALIIIVLQNALGNLFFYSYFNAQHVL
jgi:hypothetical protein